MQVFQRKHQVQLLVGLVRLGCMPFAATGGTREKVPDCTSLPPHVSLDSKDEGNIWKGAVELVVVSANFRAGKNFKVSRKGCHKVFFLGLSCHS